MPPPGASVVLAFMLSLVGASTLQAQDQEWEGKLILDVNGSGFVHENIRKALDQAGLRKDEPMTRQKKDLAIKELFKTGKFENVDVEVKIDAADATKVHIVVVVKEYIIVEKVEFKGIHEIPLNTLKPNLRITGGEALNPFHLKQDREYIRDQYLQKVYHFSSV